MTLEALVRKRLAEDPEIADRLAVYGGRPAVFSLVSPGDEPAGWEGDKYPRIICRVERRTGSGRKRAGILSLCLLCGERGTAPDELDSLAAACVEHVRMQPDDSAGYCFCRIGTRPLKAGVESGSNPAPRGLMACFEILEYGAQEMADPDPVLALNRYIKKQIPDSLVLGLDAVGEYTATDTETPVFYCRLKSAGTGQAANMVSWMDAVIAVYVLNRDPAVRIKRTAELTYALALAGELAMQDGSPMRIRRLKAKNHRDYLKREQLSVTGHYGLLHYKDRPHRVTGIESDQE